MLIVSTQPYAPEEIREILHIRTQEEDVELAPEALDLLTKIGQETSLRYAMHIIITSHLIAKKRKSNTIAIQDIQRSYTLFLDRARSVQYVGGSEYVSDEGWNEQTDGDQAMEV